MSIEKGAVTMTMSGPDGVWFGIGLDAQSMEDAPYAIIIDGDGTITERKLENHGPGTVLDVQISRVGDDTVEDEIRTVTFTREVQGKTDDHYTFPTSPVVVNTIFAIGNSPTIAYHDQRGVGSITLIPIDVDSCLCAPSTMSFLTYNNETTDAYNVNCAKNPR